MKFVYDYNKELEIFNKIKGDLNAPVRDAFEKELNSVELDNTTGALQASYIASTWKLTESNFLVQLGKFYDRDLKPADLIVYLVRFSKFPYYFRCKNKWFAAPLFSNPLERDRVIKHELVHFYQPIEFIRSIKEAIPVILNDHETFEMFSFDRGHADKEEQKWRKVIWDLYKSGRTIWDLEVE